MKIITLQPSDRVDHITEDGTELTQLPYPFHVTEDGAIQRQDFWRGRPARMVGLAKTPDPGEVEIMWAAVVADPTKAVGKYMVTADADGRWSTHQIAVASAKVTDRPA